MWMARHWANEGMRFATKAAHQEVSVTAEDLPNEADVKQNQIMASSLPRTQAASTAAAGAAVPAPEEHVDADLASEAGPSSSNDESSSSCSSS